MKTANKLTVLIAAVITLSLAGCAATDVVAKVAETSFSAMIGASAGRIAYSEKDASWVLRSPGGEGFHLPAGLDKNPDFRFEFEAAPFLAAGLDPAKLPGSGEAAYAIIEGKLIVSFEMGTDKFPASAKESLEKAFSALVKAKRDRIGYHEELDHYGISLGGGNMFEWAKDLAKNDKDIVFVLNPEPFIAAGVDPAKVEGWAFAKVPMRDEGGKPVQVDKLLKPYNLK